MILIIRRRFLVFAAVLSFLTAVFLIWRANETREARSSLRTVVVVVDPGHGGIDGGCGEGALREKKINLETGLAVRDFLRQAGVRVRTSRSGDYALEPPGRPGRHRRDLSRRIRLFEKARALFFVSIHCDWSGDTTRSGPAVFYWRPSEISQRLGEFIQNELNFLAKQNRRAEPGNYFILKNSRVPGVIVEVGFLSNPTDRERLQDPRYCSAVAAAIGRGILKFIRGKP